MSTIDYTKYTEQEIQRIVRMRDSFLNFIKSINISEDELKHTMLLLPEYKAPEGAKNHPWSMRWLAIGYILGKRSNEKNTRFDSCKDSNDSEKV